MFTDNEMIFEPLNHALKGFYNYTEGDFRKNVHMGFIVNYNDIATYPEALVTKIRSQETQELDSQFCQNVYIKIDVCNTGYGHITQDEDVKKIYEEHKEKECPIASFAIKINNRTLIGDPVTNGKKAEIAKKIQSLILKGSKQARQNKNFSFSNLPCFDIHFHNILKGPIDYKAIALSSRSQDTLLVKTNSEIENDLEEPKFQAEGFEQFQTEDQDSKSNQEYRNPQRAEASIEIGSEEKHLAGEVLIDEDQSSSGSIQTELAKIYISPIKDITAQDLHEGFKKLSGIFGLKKNVRSVLEIQNQSLSNLLKDFPDLQLLDKVEILREDDIIDRSEQANTLANVRYFEYQRNRVDEQS